MYQFSRAVYRELSPLVVEEQCTNMSGEARRDLLEACERAFTRLASDRHYFARPARSLFNDIRVFFSIASQLRVYLIVKHHVELALEVLSRLPEQEVDGNGLPRRCQAMTRKGRPCQRPPLPRSEYCPSHQHLTENFEELEGIELAA
jgi:hypothetical protein